MSAVTVRHDGVVLSCEAPPAWESGHHGRDTVLRAAEDRHGFRSNILVRVHDVPAGVDLDALVEMVDDELDELDAEDAHVERRGRTSFAVDGAVGLAVLAAFDVARPHVRRLLQLHAFVDASDEGVQPAPSRPVFHVVATWSTEDPAVGDAVVALLTNAAVHRGTRAMPR